jgi:membrane associated rhomboid family serine protease
MNSMAFILFYWGVGFFVSFCSVLAFFSYEYFAHLCGFFCGFSFERERDRDKERQRHTNRETIKLGE